MQKSYKYNSISVEGTKTTLKDGPQPDATLFIDWEDENEENKEQFKIQRAYIGLESIDAEKCDLVFNLGKEKSVELIVES